MKKNTTDKLITLPKKTIRILEDEGKKSNLKVKNFIEKTLIEKGDEIESQNLKPNTHVR